MAEVLTDCAELLRTQEEIEDVKAGHGTVVDTVPTVFEDEQEQKKKKKKTKKTIDLTQQLKSQDKGL